MPTRNPVSMFTNATTPGAVSTPVDLNGQLYNMQMTILTSADYVPPSTNPAEVILEWSQSSSGPWEQLLDIHVGADGPAGSNNTQSSLQVQRFVEFVRARLDMGTFSGSISVTLYFQ